MHSHIIKKLNIVFLLLAMAPNLALAAPESRQQSGVHKKPPQEAIDACKGKSEGASVEIITPRGKIKLTCRTLDGQLFGVPEKRPAQESGLCSNKQ